MIPSTFNNVSFRRVEKKLSIHLLLNTRTAFSKMYIHLDIQKLFQGATVTIYGTYHKPVSFNATFIFQCQTIEWFPQ